ncbi:MAG TPA: outer membrane protein assembly factor BamA [Candidatus Polarisedimenticolaceae bacterium]
MTRRARAAATLLAATVGLAAGAAEQPERTRLHRFLEEKLSAAVRGEVRFGSLDVSVTGLEARFEDASLTIPAGDAPPLTVLAGSGSVRLAWSSLAAMAAGRVRLEELVLDAPDVAIDARWVEAFARRPKGKSAVQVELVRVRVAGGRVTYRDAAQALDARLSGANFDGVWDAYRHALVGPASASGSIVRPPIEKALPFEASGTLRWSQRGIDLERFALAGAGLHGNLDGVVRLAGATSFSATAEVEGPVSGLHAYLGEFPEIGGVARATLRIDKGGPGFLVLGEAHVDGFRLGPLAAASADARLSITPAGLELRDLRARAFGGEVTGSVDVGFSRPTSFRTDVAGSGVDVRAILDLAKLPFPVAASANGTFAVTGEPGRPETWRGSASFDAVPGPGPGLPTAGSGTVRFLEGRVAIDRAPVRLSGARLVVDVDASLTGPEVPSTVRLEGSTADAAATQRGTLTILEALQVAPPEIVRRPISGTGTLAATIVLGESPSFDLLLDLAEGAWDGQRFDAAHLDLALSGPTLSIRALRARDGASSVEASATLRVDEQVAIERLDLAAAGLPLGALLARAGVDLDADGLADAALTLEAGPAGLRGGGTVGLRDGVVFGESVDAASAGVVVEAGRWRFRDAVAHGPALDLRFELDLDPAAGTVSGSLEEANARLDRLSLVGASGLEGSGTLSLSGPFAWGPEGPQASFRTRGHDARLAKSDVALAQRAPGDLDGELRLDADGAHVRLGDTTNGRWRLAASIGWGKDLPLLADVELRDAVFGGGAAGLAASVQLTARARVSGPLARPADLTIEGATERLALQVGPRTIVNEGPIPFGMTSGALRVGPASLRGEASRFDAELRVDVASGILDGRLDGTVDLSVLGVLIRDLRASGVATAALEIGGTLEAPRLDGRIDVDGARARILGFPQPIEDLRATATFEGDVLRVDGASAQVGGGQVLVQGSWHLSGAEAGRYDFTLDATRVTLTYPVGFRGIYDADLRLAGDVDRGRLTGRVDLVQGLYDRDFDAAALITEPVRAVSGAEEPGLPENVTLDVDVLADGNVWMRNNLGRLEARAAMDVGGSLARPEVTGRVELVEGGKIRFRGVDYTVESGTVDLVDRQRILPLVDFRGRTRVREYEIELHVEGTVDKLRYELTSYPALSEQDIISLLLTGQTIDALQSDSPSGGASTDVAASYFAGFLTGRFSRPVEKALGLEQFQITPLVAPGQADPTARVTVAKQLGTRLRFAYSVDVGTVDSEIYQLEWDMTRRFRFLLESSQDVGIGGDVTYTARFGEKNGRAEAPVSKSSVPEARAASVAIEGLEPGLASDLRERVPIREGDPFTRGDLYEGADAIRRELVERGYLQARVEPVRSAVDAAPGEEPRPLPMQRVTYAVEAGPRVEVRIEASSWRERRRAAGRLEKFWLDSLFSLDLYTEAAEVIRRDLQQRGRYASDVEHVHEAIDDASATLRYFVDPGPKVAVKEVRLEGVAALSMDLARSVVLTRPKSLLGGGRLIPEVLAEDVRALRVLYRKEGYLAVRVAEPTVTLDLDGKRATVVIRVEEGERHRVGTVEVPESLAIPAATLREWTRLTPGGVFSTTALADAEASLRERLDRAGYPDAVVVGSYALHDAVADVVVRVEPGGFRRIATIEIQGATRTRRKVLEREFQFAAGDPLSRESLLATQQRLYRLGIFRTVKLDYVPAPGEDPAAQVVRIRVQEAPPISLSFGPGYTSEEGARVTFALTHANLGGYDRSAGLQGRWSGTEKRVQVFAQEPRLFGRMIDTVTSFSWEDTEISGFLVNRRSFAARFQRKLDRRWTRLLRYNFQKVDVEPGENPDPLDLLDQKITNLRLGDVGIAYTRDTRDDPFLPTRGGVASAELRVFAPPLFSDESFAKLFLQGSLTRGIGDRWSYSASVRIGAAKPWSSTTFVPLSERYFAGGDSTLRGFPRDGVGVQFEGVDLGGEGLLLVNQELRRSLWRSLKLVTFVDIGNVYLRLADFDLGDLRESAGLGFRYETPIGPLRAEYGWKLDRREGESPGEFHLAIGAVF